jgi:hypothetical protein
MFHRLAPRRITLSAPARVALVLTPAALLVFGIWTSLRVSYAELLFHRNTRESVEHAARLDPANERYRAWLAELLDNEGQDATAVLDAAARLNPLDSHVWIRRGLNAEMKGDTGGAERLLLHTAEIDRLFEPRWTLMNFYFRQGRADLFWRWAREAFAISYGDRTPLFELCWRVREDAAAIAAVLPASPMVRMQFAGFLVTRGRAGEAATIAEPLITEARREDASSFVAIVDGLLTAGDTGRAVTMWNALCRRGLLSFRELNVASADSLTNARFEHAPSNRGFDWRVPTTPGVTNRFTGSSMRFTFDGHEPEQCDLMTQTIPLAPGRRYRLRFTYRTSGVTSVSGLRVRAADRSISDLASDDWLPASLEFASDESGSGSIALEYRRPIGSARIEGSVDVREFALEFAE